MKKNIPSTVLYLFLAFVFPACDKSDDAAEGTVSGKVTDSKDQPVSGAKVIVEHTVWYNSYVSGTSGNNGTYSIEVPASPEGDWTAKAQLERTAYGQTYKFDLLPNDVNYFNAKSATVRNFTWKLSGAKPGNTGYYGAHVDIYPFGTSVQPDQVKLVFTPLENTLIDGSAASSFERNIEDVAGTFMVKDVPIGRYKVKAVYTGKTLYLDNRDDNGAPALEKEVVFGKNATLGETEYNIEFWLTE